MKHKNQMLSKNKQLRNNKFIYRIKIFNQKRRTRIKEKLISIQIKIKKTHLIIKNLKILSIFPRKLLMILKKMMKHKNQL